MKPYPTRAVFFDLDGTLIQTAQSFEKAFHTLNLYPLPFDDMANFLAGVDWRALIDYLFRKQPENIDTIRATFDRYYSENIIALTQFYPLAQETLTKLRAQGLLVGIISNKGHQLCSDMHAALHFDIDFLLGSGKIPFKKPHPAPLLEACRVLNLYPQECLYIGDMPSDLEAARWAGMQGIYARYGLHHLFNPQFQFPVAIDTLDEVFSFIQK